MNNGDRPSSLTSTPIGNSPLLLSFLPSTMPSNLRAVTPEILWQNSRTIPGVETTTLPWQRVCSFPKNFAAHRDQLSSTSVTQTFPAYHDKHFATHIPQNLFGNDDENIFEELSQLFFEQISSVVSQIYFEERHDDFARIILHILTRAKLYI